MAWQLEVQDVTIDRNNFKAVSFQQPFPVGVTPVVVLLTDGDWGEDDDDDDDDDYNSDPAVVRIRNVTNTGFEFAIVEPPPEDGRYAKNTTLSYVAVEPGVHQFPNGDILEAGALTTAAVQHGSGVPGGESWVTQSLDGGFTTSPAVVGMPQTTNNEQSSTAPGDNDPSFPFVTMAMQNVAASSFQTANERSEVNNQPLLFIFQPETLGYIVMDNGAAGSFTDNDGATVSYEAFRSGDNVRGWANGCYQRPFGGFFNSYSRKPKAFASKNRHDGGDGGWVRRCSLSTTSIGLTVDEDRDRDSERSHTAEDIGVIIFAQEFVANITADPTPWLRKTVTVDNDPINNGVRPKAIAGAEVIYTIRVENLGDGTAVNVQLDDAVPNNMDLYVANTENCGAVEFRDGTPSSGLLCSALNVSYDDGSGNYIYTPPPATDFDPAVTDIRIEFTGTLAADTGSGVPSFEVDLRMRVR